MLSINVYLESFAFGRFDIGYGKIGPTEIRVILIALNTALALGAGLDFQLAHVHMTVFDVVGLAIAATMAALLVGRASPRKPARALAPRTLGLAALVGVARAGDVRLSPPRGP